MSAQLNKHTIIFIDDFFVLRSKFPGQWRVVFQCHWATKTFIILC
eukprot:UN26621